MDVHKERSVAVVELKPRCSDSGRAPTGRYRRAK